jgi:hypothetical protein
MGSKTGGGVLERLAGRWSSRKRGRECRSPCCITLGNFWQLGQGQALSPHARTGSPAPRLPAWRGRVDTQPYAPPPPPPPLPARACSH